MKSTFTYIISLSLILTACARKTPACVTSAYSSIKKADGFLEATSIRGGFDETPYVSYFQGQKEKISDFHKVKSRCLSHLEFYKDGVDTKVNVWRARSCNKTPFRTFEYVLQVHHKDGYIPVKLKPHSSYLSNEPGIQTSNETNIRNMFSKKSEQLDPFSLLPPFLLEKDVYPRPSSFCENLSAQGILKPKCLSYDDQILETFSISSSQSPEAVSLLLNITNINNVSSAWHETNRQLEKILFEYSFTAFFSSEKCKAECDTTRNSPEGKAIILAMAPTQDAKNFVSNGYTDFDLLKAKQKVVNFANQEVLPYWAYALKQPDSLSINYPESLTSFKQSALLQVPSLKFKGPDSSGKSLVFLYDDISGSSPFSRKLIWGATVFASNGVPLTAFDYARRESGATSVTPLPAPSKAPSNEEVTTGKIGNSNVAANQCL